MPPKCCTSDHIPLKHVQNLLSYQNKKLWNKKYLEYTTVNRIYCPGRDCGEWIEPRDIQNNIGTCRVCMKQVCATCGAEAHGDGECPQDPDMLKFFETAERNKYQQCHNCKAMVELERGCNHMYVYFFFCFKETTSEIFTGHVTAPRSFATSVDQSGSRVIALGSIMNLGRQDESTFCL